MSRARRFSYNDNPTDVWPMEISADVCNYRCIQCQDNLCQSCAAAHKKTKVTRGHILASFEQIRLGKYDSDIRQSQRVNCNRHPLQASNKYCYNCEQLFCIDCKDHAQHETTDVADKVLMELDLTKSLTKTIDSRLPSYVIRQELLRGYVSRLEHKHNEVSQAINERAELLHQLVDSRRVRIIINL